MTVLEKIKRCVSLVWDFQEIYGEEDIEDFCRNELHTYPQHNEIMEYFKHIEELENKLANADYQLEGRDNEIAELKKENENLASIAEHQQSSNMKRYFEIEELKRENAELKKNIANDVDKKIYVQLAKKAELADVQKGQLTTAKELIEDMYDVIPSNHSDYYKDVMERAKQFISDVEK